MIFLTLHLSEVNMSYWVLAYYFFTPIESPEEEKKRHKDFFTGRDVTCRIYLSKEGINGQMSASIKDAESYMAWLCSDPRFKDVDFKIHTYHEQVFPRVTVKVKSQLVALDKEVDVKKTAEHLSSDRWAQMIRERDENTVIIDVRNDYEWKVGHFEGADLPCFETFRQFPEYIKKLKKERDLQKTKVMMYCTGGIRCELYSVLVKEEGFQNVYQLEGGILKYGLEKGTQHWRGRLFVFDDRLTVPIHEKEGGEVISACKFCAQKSDLYYNCAHMDCNDLFIACVQCAEKMEGCCSLKCQEAPRDRVRTFEKKERPKPYRRLLHKSLK